MQAGVAVADITPPAGTELSGGAFGPAAGVLHPLQARLLCLEQGPERLMLISCDLLGFGEELSQTIRRRIARQADVPFDAILLTATHTHGGPATVSLRGWGQPDAAYCQQLTDTLANAAAASAAAMRPASLGSARGLCSGVSVNRSLGEEAPTNDMLTVVRIDAEDGGPLAMAVNYAAHPVNLHSMGQITPDYPHYVQRQVQEALQTDAPVLFLTGACGDLNPANFRQGQPSEDAAAQTGRRIGEKAVELLRNVRPHSDAPLAFATIDVAVPLQPLPETDELEAIIAERGAKMAAEEPSPANWTYCGHRAAVEWAREALQARARGQRKSITVRLHAMRLGQAAVVGIPGELFSEFGRAIADAASEAIEHPFAVTLANGCLGYFPSAAAYERRTYEAVHCPRFVGLELFDPAVGERICQGSLTLLGQLEHLHRNAQNRRLWGRATRVIVGGGQAHKRPVKYLYRGGPAFAQRASGCRFWDADGNEYIDYLLGYGPIVVGHCDPEVTAAVREQMEGAGTVFSVEHPMAIDLAETLVETIPSAEMVMFFVGGSSTTLGAVRCARAHTGREVIVRCGYHGWYDAFPPVLKGVSADACARMVDVRYNDLDALAERLERHRGQVAGVIIESVQEDGPAAGYFDGVRRLCDEHGALFILDEVKTGFRFALGGAQERFGIQPDLSCFGKAMCNGYPGSALVGRREVMEDREDTFMAATFHSDLLSIAAARATIDIVRRKDAPGHFERHGRRLIDGLNEVLVAAGLPLRIGGFAAMPAPAETTPDDPVLPMPPAWRGHVMGAWCGALQRRGVYATGHVWFLSLAHGQEEIEQTIRIGAEAAEDALRELRAVTAVAVAGK